MVPTRGCGQLAVVRARPHLEQHEIAPVSQPDVCHARPPACLHRHPAPCAVRRRHPGRRSGSACGLSVAVAPGLPNSEGSRSVGRTASVARRGFLLVAAGPHPFSRREPGGVGPCALAARLRGLDSYVGDRRHGAHTCDHPGGFFHGAPRGSCGRCGRAAGRSSGATSGLHDRPDQRYPCRADHQAELRGSDRRAGQSPGSRHGCDHRRPRRWQCARPRAAHGTARKAHVTARNVRRHGQPRVLLRGPCLDRRAAATGHVRAAERARRARPRWGKADGRRGDGLLRAALRPLA